MNLYIPQFPLQLVAFPGELLNLHIFEPRYRELIRDCETKGKNFGITPFLNGELQQVGTVMRLAEIVERYPNGKLDIRTLGISRYIVKKFDRHAPGKKYGGAEVEILDNVADGFKDNALALIERTSELYELLNIDKSIPTSVEAFSSFDLAHYIGLDPSQEVDLLQINSEADRQVFMLNHLNTLIPKLKGIQNMKDRIQANGHFKNIIPPEI